RASGHPVHASPRTPSRSCPAPGPCACAPALAARTRSGNASSPWLASTIAAPRRRKQPGRSDHARKDGVIGILTAKHVVLLPNCNGTAELRPKNERKCLIYGGQGRSRTTDTRIFSYLQRPAESTERHPFT